MRDPNDPPDPASSPDQLALRLLSKLDEKLAKTRYRRIYEQRGQRILLLTCEDFFFDQVNLARVEEALASFNPTNDQGSFAWLILSIACLPRSVFTGRFIREKALCHDKPTTRLQNSSTP
jgi:hypothetical protein